MKTLIKLIIAAVLVNAAFRGRLRLLGGLPVQGRDQQMILFGQAQTVTDLTSQILGEAGKREVPLDEDGVTVSREGARTVAEIVVHG